MQLPCGGLHYKPVHESRTIRLGWVWFCQPALVLALGRNAVGQPIDLAAHAVDGVVNDLVH